ncbi:hypothetical protein NAE50_001560 [Salmonella enterica]|uniref:hypothetical protein n=1 Tax=Salmonella enterica TaxID=28901 RepID=UPI0009AD7C05|nr:hypothetical protein [Salmonella enterica]EJG5923186.1 hypothetical protein [Salmonella enterica]ELX2843928.1 hypothetical protein [Salmonella enterica]
MATTPTKKHPKSAISQLSHDCRRKIYRAQMVVLYLSFDLPERDLYSPPLWLPFVLSSIRDDIKDIDSELIFLGLLDEAMGRKRRK